MKDRILFYENEFYLFSNFSSFAVEMFDKNWMTSEHLYQAMKFMDTDSKEHIVEEIRMAKSAHDSKKLAQKYVDLVRQDWDEIKLEKMEEIIRAKHAQHPYVQKKLKETEGLEIIENSPKDSFWGWGPDKLGRNELGKLWMKIRDEI